MSSNAGKRQFAAARWSAATFVLPTDPVFPFEVNNLGAIS
jgi:hypothetical protein